MGNKILKKTRSQIMASIKSSNTSPEVKVRKLLYRHGYRYRLHVKKLPGTPDIVMPKYKTAIFVNGCFWHYHGCHISHLPKSNQLFWQKKIKRNLERDKVGAMALLSLGWKVMIIWECSINGKNKLSDADLIKQIRSFVYSRQTKLAIEGKAKS